MGKALLIVLLGFATSFGFLANGRNRRFLDSVDRMVSHYSNFSANTASESGVYMALNRLYLDTSWRDGYTNLTWWNSTINVTIDDNTTDASIASRNIKIQSTGLGSGYSTHTEAMVFDGTFNGLAVWAKDEVEGVTTKTAAGVDDPDLLMQNAPFMPDIDLNALVTEATNQGQVHAAGTHFHPTNGYPNGDYYNAYPTPNVTHVEDDLHITGADTVYGIFIVEGKVTFESGAKVEGIIYSPNTNPDIRATGPSSVVGGVITWGEMDGTSSDFITVQYNSDYLGAFVSSFVPNNPPMRVLSWR